MNMILQDRFVDKSTPLTSGEFVNFIDGERYYAIRHVDRMAPFFISVVSDSDHWLFISSNGGLTAGRVSPETALFPYISVDKIHESTGHTGSKTLLRVQVGNRVRGWEPFNREHDGRYQVSRHLYKNLLGNKLCFEEINHDLQLCYRYTWMSSDEFGFVRQCEIQNLSGRLVELELLDGLQHVLPMGAPPALQLNSSNLIDAYKWTELDEASGLAMFTLNTGITDRPEPYESLKANTIFCLGLPQAKVLLSSLQLDRFRHGEMLNQENHKRGMRGAYFVNALITLAVNSTQQWQFVANTGQSQAQVVALRRRLADSDAVEQAVSESIESGSDQLASIMASADGFQVVAEEAVGVHHYANVLFNIQRGGGFVDQYRVSALDFANTIHHFNVDVYQQHKSFIQRLPASINFIDLLKQVQAQDDACLERLCREYLPISFGRRHGDPSRPWNQFSIKLKDDNGKPILSYQGNWRDIFQNWEALALSYPHFVENMIAKFVNASTVDGYNPYRITKQGIDWEVEEENDPWSCIGYWGDHQIIYLLKLLEQSNNFNPNRLGELLYRPIFSYANVPYRIKPFKALLANAKDTVVFDHALAELIDQRVERMGADGKLVLDASGKVYPVNLLEKLLVVLLSKLSNLVIGGGIWLNTQRPEWNDANNALVGQGLSVVTLCYLRRYICFMQNLLENETGSVQLSSEVALWMNQTADCLAKLQPVLSNGVINDQCRYQTLATLGEAACRYRQSIYQQQYFGAKENINLDSVRRLIEHALAAVNYSVTANCGSDNLYHAYNLMVLGKSEVSIKHLYPMLEGQVAALSSGAVEPEQAVSVVETLFASCLYRADQQSFLLYPDRNLPSFLDKNRILEADIFGILLAGRMIKAGDERVVLKDLDGGYRFNADIHNQAAMDSRLDGLITVYGREDIESARDSFKKLYEVVFNHQAFTGRSGGMFAFEGLGSIYWHMVSKLLLVVQENYFAAIDQGTSEPTCSGLAQLYYQVRAGIGFNKTPLQYGAFPADPYSHTPLHAGARQPGMTGQVKEEVLSRFGELGVRVKKGQVHFQPRLLREREFLAESFLFRYLDVSNQWQVVNVPARGLAFTWCQIPIVYCLNSTIDKPKLTICWRSGQEQSLGDAVLSVESSSILFSRNGVIRKLVLELNRDNLFEG